jgi:methylenetetrahydrofolate reductase (NADPH)
MHLLQTYQNGNFGLSFELFPPKSTAGEEEMYRHVEKLMAFRPDFVTCTYGAGGSTRDKTLGIVNELKQRFRCGTASHLTCVGSTVEELRQYLQEASQRGCDNIVALRGDPPKGETAFKPVAGGLAFANDLVKLIREEFPQYGIAVAGYPETHREAESPEADLENLKRKVDSGGDVVITQLFYENEDFFRFRERCDALQIQVPIVPGILPVTNLAQVQRITSLCGAKLPNLFISELEAQGEDQEGQFKVGVRQAIRQVEELLSQGIPGIHFYVLNKSPATSEVLSSVSLPSRKPA